MRTFPDVRMRAVLAQAASANQKMNQADHEGALVELRALEGRLGQLRLPPSGWVKWAIAVCLDLTDDPRGALDKIGEALDADPLNPAHHASFGVIVNRLRTRLTDALEGDPEIPRLYGRLQHEDECDLPSHLVWARHLVHVKRLDEAAKVLEAVTLLAPASLDGWQARARVERLRGNDTAAAECEAEASVRGGKPVAFGIPLQGARS
jgi:predicted Zn-dependent protease